LRLEANFAWGRKVHLATLSPLLDVDLVRFLYHTPPELLSFGGRAKGLAYASLEQRIGSGAPDQVRGATFETFFRGVMLTEGAKALAALGGAPILAELGIVDGEALDAAVRARFPAQNIGYSYFWVVLGLEAWLQARLTSETRTGI
jgi:hypothetical protein